MTESFEIEKNTFVTNHEEKREELSLKANNGSVSETDQAPKDDDTWKKKLEKRPHSELLVASTFNLTLILRNDPLLKNIVYNAHSKTIEAKGNLPWRDSSEPWSSSDKKRLKWYLDMNYVVFSSKVFDSTLEEVVMERSYHPIKEYLDNLPEWDGVCRVDTLLCDYLGAEDDEYTRAVTRKTLCAAVARIREPGIKFDTMLVLVGPQGIGKSTLVSRLSPKAEWFSDSLSFFDIKDKTASEKLQHPWIMEIGELEGMGSAQIGSLKSFLSRQDDRYRPAFGTDVDSHRRHCIFIGTTNLEHGFLNDTTGGRRFWPVHTPGGKNKKPWDLTSEEIDQIWAEVLHYVDNGEKLFLSPEIERIANEIRRNDLEYDEREGMVQDFLDTPLPDSWGKINLDERRKYLDPSNRHRLTNGTKRDVVCILEIRCECFGRDRYEDNRKESDRIKAILIKLGWKEKPNKVRVPIYGPQYVFIRPQDEDLK